MKKLLLILTALGLGGVGVWALTKAASAGCVMGVTQCRGGDLYVCEPIIHKEGDIGTRLTLLQANSPYCSSDGPRGSIYGVTTIDEATPLNDVLVMVVNEAIFGAFLSQWSKCPADPRGLAALPECFRFDNLPVGTYTVLSLHTGYITSEKQAIVTEGQDTYVVSTMIAE